MKTKDQPPRHVSGSDKTGSAKASVVTSSPPPPVAALRPRPLHAIFHAVLYLVRNSVLVAFFAVFVVQPLFFNVYLQLPGIRSLNEWQLYVVTMYLCCHALPWLVYNGCFAFMDSLHPELGSSPLKRLPPFAALGRYLATYKLPRRRTQLPSGALVKRTISGALVDQYVVVPLVGVLLTLKGASRLSSSRTPLRGFSPDEMTAYWANTDVSGFLLSFVALVPHFVISNVCNEVGFYAAHATLHSNPTLYRLFHKKHHEYTGTISIAAEYATSLEKVLANNLPSVAYFAICMFAMPNDDPRPFVQTAKVWVMMVTWLWARLWETFESHSGYCFAGSLLGRLGLLHGKRARFHDFHHTHNTGNYGGCVFMDALFHTMDPYLRYRHMEKTQQTQQQQQQQSPATAKKDA